MVKERTLTSSGAFTVVFIPCAVIRFVLFAPFGYYSAHATAHKNVIENHLKLHNGTYDATIEIGEKIAASWGKFTFYWNFAVWIPSFWFPPPFNVPFTIVDIIATVSLSKATHYQTSYAPHSKASCASAAYNWQKPAGVNESFFQAAARLNSTAATPVNMCRTFVEEWQYGIALSFFYALISVLNIIAFFGVIWATRSRDRTFPEAIAGLGKKSLDLAMSISRGFAAFIAFLLWYLPQILFRCLPFSLKTNVRFCRRYALKGSIGLERKAELGVIELKDIYKQNKRKGDPRYQGGTGSESPLSNFLSIYDMLIAVTEELHYSDVMNLSRVSKSVRDMVLPAHDFDHRIEAFKRYSCPGADKKGCWLCNKTVCTVSSKYPPS
ncbi:hypothetical protein GQ44DRAFT_615225 [Phaeosphaeriaceae sp. PMI808]|nr:hypothetical protein GQ44DRAFT_615225 [Phaeosphaeriaceae sp. PMI808]